MVGNANSLSNSKNRIIPIDAQSASRRTEATTFFFFFFKINTGALFQAMRMTSSHAIEQKLIPNITIKYCHFFNS